MANIGIFLSRTWWYLSGRSWLWEGNKLTNISLAIISSLQTLLVNCFCLLFHSADCHNQNQILYAYVTWLVTRLHCINLCCSDCLSSQVYVYCSFDSCNFREENILDEFHLRKKKKKRNNFIVQHIKKCILS